MGVDNFFQLEGLATSTPETKTTSYTVEDGIGNKMCFLHLILAAKMGGGGGGGGGGGQHSPLCLHSCVSF